MAVRPAEPFTLIALPGAPLGPCEIDYEVFCREMSAWRPEKLLVVVRAAEPGD